MILRFIAVFAFLFLFSPFSFGAEGEEYAEDEIIVGSCLLKVYKAENPRQKAKGMLGFTDATFPKDGMIFIGDKPKKQYYHTVGMKMKIRIMGVTRIGDKKYMVNGKAVYAPEGIEIIEIYGDSVFETPEALYEKRLKNCLFEETR